MSLTKRKDGRFCKSKSINGERVFFYSTETTERKALKDIENQMLMYQGRIERGKTFEEVADLWQTEHWEKIEHNTRKHYTAPFNDAVKYFGDKPIKSITASDVTAYIDYIVGKQYASKTVRARLNVLNMIAKYAVVKGYIKSNPCQYVTVPKNLAKSYRRAPTDEEIKKVVANADKPMGFFALFVLYTGLRKGEALALQYSDINFENRTVHITKSVYHENNVPHIKSPKTEHGYRTVILTDILLPYLDGKHKPSDLVFPNSDGELMTHGQFETAWNNYAKSINLKITPHNLRHGFATIGFEAGLDEKDMQDLMGHSTIQLTRDIYTHISQGRKQISADKLNGFIKNNS